MASTTPTQQSIAQLEALIADVAVDLTTRRPELASRIERAVGIASTRLAITPYGESGYQVQSECDPTRYYVVDGATCTCPDHTQRARQCKHSIAVYLLRAAYRRETAMLRALDYGQLDRFELTPKGEAYLAEQATVAVA